jgi:hypothetical protein
MTYRYPRNVYHVQANKELNVEQTPVEHVEDILSFSKCSRDNKKILSLGKNLVQLFILNKKEFLFSSVL